MKKSLPKKYIYRIVLTNRGVETKELGAYDNEISAYEGFNGLISASNDVVFPVKYNNNSTEIIESEYEIFLIKVKGDGDNAVSLVMDDSGKFSKVTASSPSWVILDRSKYRIEETFFVYGHHPRYDRKTFSWIYDEMVANNKGDKYSFKCARVYKNKLIIDNDTSFDIVICKNKRDCIRLYDALEARAKADKHTHIAFVGDMAKSKYKSDLMDRIMEKTGWSRKRIKRSSTRP